MKRHLTEIEPEDLVAVEGRGNGLVVVGERRTMELSKDTVNMIKS